MDDDTKKRIEYIKEISQKEEAVLFCYLFGSNAYGKTIPTSDIDLAIYLDRKKCQDLFEKRLELIVKFSKKIKKEADVLILNTASPFLRYTVLKEGKLIFERDRSQRIDFELKALNEYFDFKPILEMYNKHLLDS